MDISQTFNNIIAFFQGKEESVIGIDMGGSSIKVVQARKKNGRAILETYGEVATGPYVGMEIGRAVRLPPEKMVEALFDVLKEANVTTKDVGVAIPLSSSIVNLIKIPKVSIDNLKSVISIEARKYIPVPLSEVSLDWQIVSEDNSLNSAYQTESKVVSENKQNNEHKDIAIPVSSRSMEEVLVVAVHKDLISTLKNILDETKMTVRFMELESFSVSRSLLEDTDSVILVLDHGASSTKIYVFDQGVLKVSHNISIGSQDVTLSMSRATGMPIAEAERLKRTEGFNFKHTDGSDQSRLFYGSLSYIFSETGKTVREYESKHGKVIKEIILTGGGTRLKGFQNALEKIVHLPIKLAHSFAKLEYPAFMDEVIRDAGPSFSVAIGAVLRSLEEKG